MPKPRKNENIRCSHFMWRLTNRQGTWYADGRSNIPSAGRHSLGTQNREEAIRLLSDLDRVRAEDLGRIPRSAPRNERKLPLSLADGRKLYEKHTARPRVAGGVKASTRKRYRTVFDKFLEFAASTGIGSWNAVTAKTLTDYAQHLTDKNYAHKSLENELTTLKQAIRWMIQAGHLQDVEPIQLPLRKAESQRAYCYKPEEVKAIVAHCSDDPKLHWLSEVIVGLACTGLRISELASLRWTDVDLNSRRLSLTDESGYAADTQVANRSTKSGRSRHFPIHPSLLQVLNSLPRHDNYVYHGPRGGRLKPDTVRNIFVREVISPLVASEFASRNGGQGFQNGRLHSFRHYFCSTCANSGVPERMVMDWLGHADSEMLRHYYHLHDEQAKQEMEKLNFLGDADGRSAGRAQDNTEDAEPDNSEGEA